MVPIINSGAGEGGNSPAIQRGSDGKSTRIPARFNPHSPGYSTGIQRAFIGGSTRIRREVNPHSPGYSTGTRRGFTGGSTGIQQGFSGDFPAIPGLFQRGLGGNSSGDSESIHGVISGQLLPNSWKICERFQCNFGAHSKTKQQIDAFFAVNHFFLSSCIEFE